MNRFLIYFVYVVAFANILYFLNENNLSCIGVFALVAILTSFFSKNKAIILGVAIVVANVVCAGCERRQEGFKGGKGNPIKKLGMNLAKIGNNVEKIRIKMNA